MTYSPEFAARIGKILAPQASFVEKQMFGGIAFMVDDKMCVGISRDKATGEDRLMARIGPGFHHEALKLPGCREMLFTGRPMPGFVFVHPEGFETEAQLRFWIEKSLEYNRAAPEKPVKKRAKLVIDPKIAAKEAAAKKLTANAKLLKQSSKKVAPKVKNTTKQKSTTTVKKGTKKAAKRK